MKALLIETLEALGYPVYLQGTLAEGEAYPDSFITFFTTYSTDAAHYDNAAHGVAWSYQVAFYSVDPALVESVPKLIRAALVAVGFIPQGRGYDLLSDDPAHTGWVAEYDFLEMEETK